MGRKYSEDDAGDLRAAMNDAVLGWEGVTTRKMFGCPAYIVDSALFALVVTRGIVLTQLAPHEREMLSAIATVEPFKAGRKLIHKWAQVRVESLEEIGAILPYVRQSYQAALAQNSI
jgi:hypothetical protein